MSLEEKLKIIETRNTESDHEGTPVQIDDDVEQLVKAVRILAEGMEWYWRHWNTSDDRLKGDGYMVSRDAIAQASAVLEGKAP